MRSREVSEVRSSNVRSTTRPPKAHKLTSDNAEDEEKAL